MEWLVTFVLDFFDVFLSTIASLWSVVTWVWSSLIWLGFVGIVLWVLSHNQSYKTLLSWLTARGRKVRYERALDWSLTRTDNFFGPEWLWRAFSRSLSLAYIYPALFLLASWVAGIRLTFAEDPFLGVQTIGGLARFLIAAGLIVATGVIVLLVRKNETIARWMLERLFRQPQLSSRMRLLSESFVLALALVFAFAVSIAFVLVGASASVGAPVAAVSMVVIIVVVITVGGIVPITTAMAAIGVVGVTATTIGAFTDAGEFIRAVLVLYLVLPITNAFFDWLSWGVTRRLLHRLRQVNGILAVLGHVVADTVLAILFLAGLSVVLPFVVEIANAAFHILALSPLEWRPMLTAVIEHPFSAGIMVSGMLVTTLVPTAMHLGMACISLFVPHLDVERTGGWYPLRAHLLESVTNPDDDPDHLQRGHVAVWLFGAFALSWGVLLVIGAFVYALVSAFGPTGGELLIILANFGASLAGA